MVYYPRLIINSFALRHNAEFIYKLLKSHNISTIAVTKGTTSQPEILNIIRDAGISYFADSRILNIKNAKIAYPDIKYLLLRLPMLSEIRDMVEIVDMSLNSEPETIKAIGKIAREKDLVHKIILMIDLGDRREGILPGDLINTVNILKEIKGIEIVGIGANFACFGGVLPDINNLTLLSILAKDVENILGKELPFVSGGSTSSIYLVEKNKMPQKINNLRIGTGILFGIDDIRDVKIEGTRTDTFLLEAQIVELKEKPSLPFGNIAKDAFGHIPHFEDRGIRKRAILGIGKQDVVFSSLYPVDKKVEIVGGSSDHMIIDVTESDKNYKIGDILKFYLAYPAMLFLFNSSYVYKYYRR